MTYCVAIKLRDGLLFASDTRTNAGVDHVATFGKMRQLAEPGRIRLVLLSSGNLATSQSVASLLELGVRGGDPATNILAVDSLYDAAVRLGATLREVIARDARPDEGTDFSSHFLLGGQVAGEAPRLFHVYPQGNFIEATRDTPYFQIGEAKYGKPILDRVLDYDTPRDEAIKCTLISFDSTMRSNLSVGAPLDLFWHPRDDFSAREPTRLAEHDPYLAGLREQWGRGLRQAFATLPEPDWLAD
ncbi:peptidase [Crenobacter luteus]|uniref:Peptidase n=1 Tax=Crenobacter luteus TaxID=1452487 RepID=A0A163B8D9_9NEIS|nr:peptidase [Crenobacter luteus]KZE24977.1 peptidase [Crenobacter luteus]